MWYSIVVKYPGQSMQEAFLHAEQLICAYDGDVYGKREAKKLARRDARAYRGANVGEPRLVKSPFDPRFVTASQRAIRSRDELLGFYFVMPGDVAHAMMNPPRYGYDRDVLGDYEARSRAEGELTSRQVAEPSSGLHVETSDFLPIFYRAAEGADGVYELDVEAAEHFNRANRVQIALLAPQTLAEIDRRLGSGR